MIFGNAENNCCDLSYCPPPRPCREVSAVFPNVRPPRSFVSRLDVNEKTSLRLVDRSRELRAASVASNASGRLRFTEDREEIEKKEKS